MDDGVAYKRDGMPEFTMKNCYWEHRIDFATVRRFPKDTFRPRTCGHEWLGRSPRSARQSPCSVHSCWRCCLVANGYHVNDATSPRSVDTPPDQYAHVGRIEGDVAVTPPESVGTPETPEDRAGHLTMHSREARSRNVEAAPQGRFMGLLAQWLPLAAKKSQVGANSLEDYSDGE